MSALRTLIREHHTITQLTFSLEAFADELVNYGSAPRRHLELFGVAFHEMVDLIHHEKEETILLPYLARHGFTWDLGVLQKIRRDHRLERHFLDVLQYACKQSNEWSDEDQQRIVATIRALALFQRSHLSTENLLLFPEVLSRLDSKELGELEEEFRQFDQESQTDRQSEALNELIESLIESYPPVPTVLVHQDIVQEVLSA